MIRLGFAVRTLAPGAPSGAPMGGRSKQPHISRWLIGLYDVLRYLARQQISYYRLAAPEGLGTAELATQLASCPLELDTLRQAIGEARLRLSAHAGHQVVLNSAEAEIRERSAAQLRTYGLLLDALGCGADGCIVTHISAAGGTVAALKRFSAAYEQLPEPVRRRVAVEHDEAGCSLGDLLVLHQQCGVAVVLDNLHLHLHNPERLRLAEALGLALATWPASVAAEVHLSSPRSEGHLLTARRGQARLIVPPRPGQHADFIVLSDALALLAASHGMAPFDIMVEAKAGDLALLRLREDLRRLGWGDRID